MLKIPVNKPNISLFSSESNVLNLFEKGLILYMLLFFKINIMVQKKLKLIDAHELNGKEIRKTIGGEDVYAL